MSSIARRVKGSFVSVVDDPVPVAAISPHQIAAVARPGRATKSLTVALQKRSRRQVERHINDHLSDRSRA